MSMAILPKTAKERASIAIHIMKYNKNPFTRELDNCFEMGDGEAVRHIVFDHAKKDAVLLELCKKVFAPNVLDEEGVK